MKRVYPPFYSHGHPAVFKCYTLKTTVSCVKRHTKQVALLQWKCKCCCAGLLHLVKTDSSQSSTCVEQPHISMICSDNRLNWCCMFIDDIFPLVCPFFISEQLFIKSNQGDEETTKINYLTFIGTPVQATNMNDFRRVWTSCNNSFVR